MREVRFLLSGQLGIDWLDLLRHTRAVLIVEAQPAMAQIDQHRLQDSRQHHDRQRASDHDDRQRLLRLGTDSRRDRRRQQSECVNQVGHHRGAKTTVGAGDDRLDKRIALLPKPADVEDCLPED